MVDFSWKIFKSGFVDLRNDSIEVKLSHLLVYTLQGQPCFLKDVFLVANLPSEVWNFQQGNV